MLNLGFHTTVKCRPCLILSLDTSGRFYHRRKFKTYLTVTTADLLKIKQGLPASDRYVLLFFLLFRRRWGRRAKSPSRGNQKALIVTDGRASEACR